jgi:hypothetical protein
MTRPPIRVLDVIQRLSPGGAGRALIADAIHCARLDAVRHEVLSLLPPEPHAARLAAQAGVAVHGAGDAPGVAAALARADIVRIHFWNAPEIHALLAGALPPARILLRCLTNGAHPPHAIPPQAAARADALAVSAASTLALPALRAAMRASRSTARSRTSPRCSRSSTCSAIRCARRTTAPAS